MPAPPSLVLLPPSPIMKRRTPVSSSAAMSSPTPPVERAVVVRVRSDAGRRMDPRAGEVRRPRDGAREHRDRFVAVRELVDLGVQHLGRDERCRGMRRVVRRERSGRARRRCVGRPGARPSTRASSGTVIAPGRSSTGAPPANETIVDSMPTAQAPPSRIIATASPRSSATCCAVVGEMRPKRLAEGAAMPSPKASSSARATGCDGTRRPTLSWPPVTMSGTLRARGRISVSGPGQNAAASAIAPSGTARAHSASRVVSYRCTMTGWSAGRPFAAKMRRTAAGSRASAPSPYTVSVGKATSSPARRRSAARAIAAGVGASIDALIGATAGDARAIRRRRPWRVDAGAAANSARIQAFAWHASCMRRRDGKERQ